MNWDDLEMALTSNAEEWTCYLDVRNGEVQMVALDRFGGDDDRPSDEEIDAELEAGHLIHVEPLESSVEYGWMTEFAESVDDARLRTGWRSPWMGAEPSGGSRTCSLGHPAERERWFAFRDARVRAAAREWLAEQGIEPATAPQCLPGKRRRAPGEVQSGEAQGY